MKNQILFLVAALIVSAPCLGAPEELEPKATKLKEQIIDLREDLTRVRGDVKNLQKALRAKRAEEKVAVAAQKNLERDMTRRANSRSPAQIRTEEAQHVELETKASKLSTQVEELDQELMKLRQEITKIITNIDSKEEELDNIEARILKGETVEKEPEPQPWENAAPAY